MAFPQRPQARSAGTEHTPFTIWTQLVDILRQNALRHAAKDPYRPHALTRGIPEAREDRAVSGLRITGVWPSCAPLAPPVGTGATDNIAPCLQFQHHLGLVVQAAHHRLHVPDELLAVPQSAKAEHTEEMMPPHWQGFGLHRASLPTQLTPPRLRANERSRGTVTGVAQSGYSTFTTPWGGGHCSGRPPRAP